MSSRRQLQSTDETNYSVGSEIRRDAELTRQYLKADKLSLLPAVEIIKRSLSVTTVVSTSSSFAQRSQQAVGRPDLQRIVEIGAGLQGAVFEQIGKSVAMKKEYPGNGNLRTNLLHEYSLHQAVFNAFDHYEDIIQSDVQVPRPQDMILATNDTYWTQHLEKFPAKYRQPGNMVLMERILPLPKAIRQALITQFYPRDGNTTLDSATITRVLNKTPNKHCLARVYLGKSTGSFNKEGFTLRNFPLYLNSMQELGMDVKALASAMGKAFAIMHWGAGVSGDDVEFVLGSSAIGLENDLNFQQREIRFYLLDFGQCDEVNFSDNVEDVYQAFKGAMILGDNQSFIPHYRNSGELYTAFREGYIKAGQYIVEEKGLGGKFNIEEFIREYQEYAEDFL